MKSSGESPFDPHKLKKELVRIIGQDKTRSPAGQIAVALRNYSRQRVRRRHDREWARSVNEIVDSALTYGSNFLLAIFVVPG